MILVIGGSSFIGVYTVENLLNHNCDVCVTARNNKFREYYETLGVQYYNLDLTNNDDFEKLPTKNIEGVILLAGYLPANASADLNEKENAATYFEVNTIGTINVLEYCRKNNIKRVISTCSYADVINSWTADYPITEDEPRNYLYSGDHAVYVFSKNAANDVLEYYNQQHGMKNAIFRFPMVYGVGPHGKYNINGKKVKSGFQIFVENAMEGKDIVIYGNKNVKRDAIYVKDVAEAFYRAIKSDKTEGLYNMTSGKCVSLFEQAQIISDVFGSEKKSKVINNPKIKNNSKSFWFSIEKAKKDFNYQPQYSDFKKMMEDYKSDLENQKFKNLFKY